MPDFEFHPSQDLPAQPRRRWDLRRWLRIVLAAASLIVTAPVAHFVATCLGFVMLRASGLRRENARLDAFDTTVGFTTILVAAGVALLLRLWLFRRSRARVPMSGTARHPAGCRPAR